MRAPAVGAAAPRADADSVANRFAIVRARTLILAALASVAALALLAFGGVGVAVAAAPTIISASTPSTVAPDSEQVSVQVDPGGYDTGVVFQYGADTGYGSFAPGTTGTPGSPGTPGTPLDVPAGSPAAATTTITGLTPGDTYHVQALASNLSYNGVAGPDQTFVAGAPQATTGGAVAAGSSETLSGTVNPEGSATNYYFDYGPGNGVLNSVVLASAPSVNFDASGPIQVAATPSSGTTAGDQSVSATLTGLAPGAYQYEVVAINAYGTVVYGGTGAFTVGAAQATTGSATQDAIDGAVVNGTLNPEGSDATYHFDYGLTASYGSSTNATDAGSGTADLPETATLTGLATGSLYHYRLVVTNAAGTVYGADETFTLGQSFANTSAPTDVTDTSATLNGVVGGGGLTTTYWFQYSTDLSFNLSTASQTAPISGSPQDESAAISGLTPGLAYNYRLVISNASGTFYGQPVAIRGAPEVDTYPSPIGVDNTDVTLHSQVNPNGLDTTVQYEFGTASGTYGAPVPASPIDDGSGSDDVDAPYTLGSLTPGTVYYYRVIATNSAGSATGPEQTFTSPNTPAVTAQPATAIVANAAVLNADVTANNYGGTYYFEYGPSLSYGQMTTAVGFPASANGLGVSAQITGLAANTTYDYAIVVANGVAADQQVATGQFTTAATDPPPVPGTPTASNITDTTATVQATLDPNGQDAHYYFEYETTAAYQSGGCGGTPTPSTDGGSGSIDEPETVNLTGLTPGTQYTVCLVATWAGNQSVASAAGGALATLIPPVPTTGAATVTGSTTATLAGTVNPNGFATQVYIQYGTTTAYGSSTTPQSAGSGTSVVAVSPVIALANLVAGTTYHYRLVATNGVDTADGADMTFATQAAPQPPAFTDPGPSAIDDCDATINASINPEGQATTWSVRYGTTTAYGTTLSAGSVGSGTSSVPVSVSLSGVAPPCSQNPGLLTPDTKYHYEILATNPTGTTVETDQTFTTFTPPSATTGAAAAPGSTTVTLNANVNPNGFATTYSFQYGLTSAYGSTSSSAAAGAGTSAQSVALTIGSLTPSTTYHYRVVATNGPDTVDGADQTFTTSTPPAPSASTETSFNVSASGATISAEVNPLGQATTYQFQYGTDTSYGTTTAVQSVGAGSLPQPATVALTELAPATTYHFRVVATSANGTTLGSDASFTTLAAAPGSSGGSGGSTGSGSTGSGSSGSGSGGSGSGGAGAAGGAGGGSAGGGSGGSGAGGSHGASPVPPTLAVLSAPSERLLTGAVTLDTGVRVSCPAGGPSCSVSIPVSYVVSQVVPASHHKPATVKKVTKTLVSASQSLAPGHAVEATVPLPANALAVVTAAKRLKATARVSAWASGGAGRTLPIAVTLTPRKVPSKHH